MGFTHYRIITHHTKSTLAIFRKILNIYGLTEAKKIPIDQTSNNLLLLLSKSFVQTKKWSSGEKKSTWNHSLLVLVALLTHVTAISEPWHHRTYCTEHKHNFEEHNVKCIWSRTSVHVGSKTKGPFFFFFPPGILPFPLPKWRKYKVVVANRDRIRVGGEIKKGRNYMSRKPADQRSQSKCWLQDKNLLLPYNLTKFRIANQKFNKFLEIQDQTYR